MKRALYLSLALILTGAMARPAMAAGSVKAEILRNLGDAEEKLVKLAEATPAEKFGWRPAEKVRSTGEVFLHVAGGNYYLATFWGAKPPEGVNLKDIEKDGADKAKVIDALKKSFVYVRQSIEATPDADLDKAVKVFGQDGTVREVFLIVVSHAHEHLGQSIAYARMNGITPPWSA